MEGKDLIIYAFIFFLVFNFNSMEEMVTQDPMMEKWRKFYRERGVDRIQAEDIREELIRRGVPDPPNFTMTGENATDVMAELQTLLQKVPYVKTEMDKTFTDKTPSFSSRMTPWPRRPETDDV